MLDPWIIEEIRRREDHERAEREQRPMAEIPMDMPRYPEDRRDDGNSPKQDRGVVIVDFTI
jgi:hypothetical protein